MPKILIENYSNFVHIPTGTQFSPVLDRRIGLWVGVADVESDVAEVLLKNPRFRQISAEEWLEMTSLPAIAEPSEPVTGDPLGDTAGEVAGDPLGEAPAPPGKGK